ncbi:metallophosphoesterase family protein [Ammoniphilus resinae]|uniref:Calcineurin-like phosphoesterase domain-containing protein n=1 Tax=Ammoniphilus resinae TaxID=861532 RepID=A0ABS4GRA5_9BACL|nr:metallophosphoesterase [Ammoniphilus resinae]MBP1932807.1 hypothetical protein [Ammoniphilus resinae]
MTYPTFRNPILSLWQSAISKAGKNGAFSKSDIYRMNHFVQVANAFLEGRMVPFIDYNRNVIDECTKIVAALAKAEIQGDRERYQELMNRFKMSTCDPGWHEALKTYLAFKKDRGVIPYVRYKQLNDFVMDIPANIKIAFLADWGTGTKVAEWSLKAVKMHHPDLIIHLGDIYYSGTMDEVQDYFLAPIKKIAGSTPVYTLAGNHEMYSGGKGYYWLLQQLNQPASYFCLRNNYWQILGLDTGLHSSNPFLSASNVTYLDQAEERWHLHKFSTAGSRKTILLSHHPLFSSLGVGKDGQGQTIAYNPFLRETFRSVMDQVSLWLWGHEHNQILFDPYINLKKGRCIGSGAIPMMVDQKPFITSPHLNLQGKKEPPVMNLNKAKLSINQDGFLYNSYAILSLTGDQAQISYYEVNSIQKGDSRLIFSESVEK